MTQNQDIISIATLMDKVCQRRQGIEWVGACGSEKAYFLGRLYARHPLPMLVVVSSAAQAVRFADNLRFFTAGTNCPVLYFPPYNILPFKFLSYHNETAAKRIGVLYQLLETRVPPIVVVPLEALLKKIIPRHQISSYAELVMTGEEIERDRLIEKLMAGGYARTSIVEEPGDFCIRGGILDVFSAPYEDPLRIEFFGDVVDSLRFFSAASQRKINAVEEAVILPAKEVILDENRMARVISRVRARAAELKVSVTQVRKIVDHIRNGRQFEGIESLISLIYSELETLFDYLPGDILPVVDEPEALAAAAETARQKIIANYEAACRAEHFCADPAGLYLDWSIASRIMAGKNPLSVKALEVMPPADERGEHPARVKAAVTGNSDISAALRNFADHDHLLKPLAQWLADQNQAGRTCLVVCTTPSRADQVVDLLAAYDIRLNFVDGFNTVEMGEPGFYVCVGQVDSGFVWAEAALAVITEEEIFGAKSRRKKPSTGRVRSQLLDLQELKKDDLIVHSEHGIGRYSGLVKLSFDGVTNDFLSIVYKGGDKLYLPVDRMGLVQKYMGVEGIEPVLDQMGGKSWQRVKARVKRSAEKIAGELLKLYARRKVEKGHAFSLAHSYLRDFETGFAFEETADQIRAIEDVIDDMQAATPMDRLICGDVGYGKTEVALRASFLTAENGKQTAMLVPTTILAEQHYATFCSRFERFAINVACLSRFRSIREQRDIIDDLKNGKVDIVVGTHRLLQKDVAFKDLGLLILDEEQRFGVKHKEKLKRFRSAVDVLTLTATPIPRTLHMSLMGIRDISIISTPPEYRRSIITYVCEFDDVVVAEAIRKELNRGGQVFFVHNNIHSIDRVAAKLKQLVPEARLAVAHGRMHERQLEEVMFLFVNKEIDLLVCTAIIESGLDIPSANTIIVNRADRFGLAQIYQLRGRVGRFDEQAYAYLLIPHESLLSKDAQKRLKVLMEHSDLGSGFQIAMNDLKIRGGGTILGASQSGHIAAVGYDMFLKLMETAIAELKGQPVPETLDPEVNISLSSFLPESYIPDLDQRLIAYRRLAKMTALEEISEYKAELIDRYGPLPAEAGHLLRKIVLKVLAKKAGVARIDLTDRQMMLHFSKSNRRNLSGVVEMILAEPQRFELTPAQVLKARLAPDSRQGQLVQAKNLLKEIIRRVSN